MKRIDINQTAYQVEKLMEESLMIKFSSYSAVNFFQIRYRNPFDSATRFQLESMRDLIDTISNILDESMEVKSIDKLLCRHCWVDVAKMYNQSVLYRLYVWDPCRISFFTIVLQAIGSIANET